MAQTQKTMKAKKTKSKKAKSGPKPIVGQTSKPVVLASGGLVKAIRAVAKQETLRLAETKYVNELTLAPIVVNQYVSTPNSLYRLLPNVQQGTDDAQRIGNKISPVKARSHFTFYFQSSNSQANWVNDIEVNFIIVKAKGYDSDSARLSIPPDSLLKNGAGGVEDPSAANVGNQQTALVRKNMFPVNTDLYTVLLRKTFVMRKGPGNQNTAPAGGEIAPTGVLAHEDCYKFTYDWVPPTLEYNKQLDLLPQAHNPLAICWCTSCDTAAAQSGALEWAISSDLYFKDT